VAGAGGFFFDDGGGGKKKIEVLFWYWGGGGGGGGQLEVLGNKTVPVSLCLPTGLGLNSDVQGRRSRRLTD